MPTPPEFPSAMPAAQVRHPLLKGRQPVAGLWFPSDWFDEAARSRRIVDAWHAGAQAFRFAEGDLLCFAAPASLDCDHAIGWPLRREGQALCSAELDPAERAGLPPADVWLVNGGEVLALRLAQAEPLDPSLWLAPGPVLFDTFDCRETLPEPVVLDAEGRTLREVLGDAVPPASAEQAEFLKVMAERAQREKALRQVDAGPPGTAAPGSTPRGSGAGISMRAVAWLAGIAAALFLARALFYGLSGSPAVPPGASAKTRMADSQVDASSLWVSLIVFALVLLLAWWGSRRNEREVGRASRRAVPKPGTGPGAAASSSKPLKQRGTAQPDRSRWRDWMARLAITSRLSRLLGRQQAAYLSRMLKMFDDGNLEQALRHAIPLGGDMQSLGQAFGTPGPRSDLSLSGSLGQGPSINLGNEFEAHLRQLYRKTFEKLDREGRVDEAVFVLAELLQSRQEALDYLEKHQRHAQAAELALAWDWPPAVIVRLLCLAGDWRRALAVARRDNAFASAVLQLQDRWPDAANRLREEWGQALSQQGEWLKAVDAVWPVVALREQAAAWLLAAEAAGGQLAARALVQRALLLPDTLQACAARLQSLRDDPSLHGERAALAAALNAATGHTEASRGLVAVLTPALLADQSQGRGRFDKKALQSLLRLNPDTLLQADLPGGELPGTEARSLLAQSAPLSFEAPAAGAHAVLDAVLLDEDRYLVATGEAGALMTDATGRVLARFAVPAYRLVVAHSGQLALALAQRDGLWRVSRIDLVQRQVSDLGLSEIDHFAGEFDGIGWTVAHGRRVQVIYTGRSLRDVLWQVNDLPGVVTELSATREMEQFIVDDDVYGPSLWRYQCPQRRLLSREPLAVSPGAMSRRMLHPQLVPLGLRGDPQEDGSLELSWLGMGGMNGRLRFFTTDAGHVQSWIDSDWMVLRLFDTTCDVFFHQLRGGRLGARVSWPAAAQMCARAVPGGWLLFDDQGRVLHLDTARSTAAGFAIR
ncbi:bpX6 domain-containing protein [Variovorax gossypii]